MADIWHIGNPFLPEVRLWRLGNGKFQVIESGNYTETLTNSQYTLIKGDFVSELQKINEQVTCAPAIIYDLKENTERADYFELFVVNRIDPSTINEVHSHEKKIWIHPDSDAVFVSTKLKDAILLNAKENINSNPGFSFFC